MEQEAKLRSQVDRGETARVVLNEIKTAAEALEKQCFATFRNSDIHDSNGRTMCRLYLQVLDDVITRFTVAVRTGEAAHHELVRLKEPNKLRKLVGI